MAETARTVPFDMMSIQWWEPETGELLACVPTAAAQAAALTAPITDKRPSRAQESHIRIAAERRASGSEWSPWLAGAFTVNGKLDRSALAKMATMFVRRHGTLWSWFDVEDVQAPLERRVLDPADIEFETESLGQFDDPDELREFFWKRLNDLTSPLVWPSLIVGAIDLGEKFVIYFGVDHSHSDGVSLILAGEELYDFYDLACQGLEDNKPPTGSYIDFADAERTMADETLDLTHPAVHTWLAALEKTGGKVPGFPLPLGLKPGELKPSIRTRVDLLTFDECKRVDAAAKSVGGGVSAGVYACLALVGKELADQDAFMALNAVMTRADDPAHWMSQGWYVNLVPISAVLESGSFLDAVKLTQESLVASRAATMMPVRHILDAVAEMGLADGLGATSVPPMVSYVDYSKFPLAQHQVIEKVIGIVGPGSTGDLSMWINRGEDKMYVVMSHPDTPEALDSATRFADKMKEIFLTVARDGDYTIPG